MKDTIVFTFARMNPPTIGHLKLISTIARESREHDGAPTRIVVSRAHDKKNNPLAPLLKMEYLRTLFPDDDFVLATDELPTMFDHLRQLSEDGFKNLIFVCGSDRYGELMMKINQYNGDLYDFDTIKFVSSGDRSGGSPTSRASGTLARQLARDGDLRNFFDIIPRAEDGYDIVEIYDELRSAMGINTSNEEDTHEEAHQEEQEI